MPTLKEMLKGLSQAKYVEYGYGQVEPNHLSAQRNGQIYAQLPVDPEVKILENGQFAKYDYPAGLVKLESDVVKEWMLVFNEIKLYRDGQFDCEFAMKADDYVARVYSPAGGKDPADIQLRYYNGVGKDREGNEITEWPETEDHKYMIEDVTASADPYELHYNEDPFHILGGYKEKMMPAGTSMMCRLFRTHVGDIYTTNMIDEDELEVGDILKIGDKGILSKGGSDQAWVVSKVYTMPDGQRGVKIMRVE